MARLRHVLPAALLFAPLLAIAQGDPPAPPRIDYALTNVRIVQGPGRVIDRGTVLIQNGRIAAVGATVNVPAGVAQLNLSGHSVFPGLIDAATSTGLPSATRSVAAPAAAAAPAGRGGGGGGAPAPGGRGGGVGGGGPVPTPVLPQIDAGAEAADLFAPTPEQLESLRAGGITTVGLVFNGGLFPGRAGVALTGGYDESRLALRPGVAQQASFGTRPGGYPGTLIGALAFIKQGFLDAQYELSLDRAFKAGRPAPRPSNDPFKRALIPAAAGEMPVWFTASTERELTRVAEIVKDVGLRNVAVVGAREGYRSIPTLKGINASAIVSVDPPAAGAITGRTFITTGVPAPPPSADAAILAEARANAATLAKAGVPVAFASYGSESGATFRDRIRAIIEAGMTPDEALRAATVTPATILGIAGVVGTIETGKLANLVVVNGNDLFASGTPIRHVFVEGRLYTMGTR